MTEIQEPPPDGRLTDHIQLGVLAAAYSRDLIEEVVRATGRREKRSRLLPAHVMVRYVIALGLFFGEGYDDVIRRLTGSLRALDSWEREWKVPSTSAITQARQRLGAEPLRELFRRAAVPIAGVGTRGAWLCGWRLMALEGTTFDVPDTSANVAVLNRRAGGPKASAFPELQVVGLSECGTHAYVAAAMGSSRLMERVLARGLTGAVTADMLVTADVGFYSWQLWEAYAATGAALCWRVGSGVQLPLVKHLDDGSYLALLFAPNTSTLRKAELLDAARAGGPVDGERARIIRVVEYTVPDCGTDEPIRVITTVLDPDKLTAADVAFAHHQRWDRGSGLDEIKAHLRGGGGVLRSKSPDMVEQEMWGLLLAHYAIRKLMHRATDEAGEDSERASFLRGVRVLHQVDDPAAAAT